MIQRFIEIGQGYSDIYELLEVGRNQKHRVARLLAMHTTINDKKVTSLVIVMEPTDPGKFQPLYICREGIPNPHATKTNAMSFLRTWLRNWIGQLLKST